MNVTKFMYVVYASIDGKQCRLKYFLKPFIGEMFTYKKHSIHRSSSAMVIYMVTDIKQTCLGQGLGVTFTARKLPSRLMFTIKDQGHTQVTDVTTFKKALQTTALNN